MSVTILTFILFPELMKVPFKIQPRDGGGKSQEEAEEAEEVEEAEELIEQ